MRKIRVFDFDGSQKEDHVVPENVLVSNRFNKHVVFESVNIENQNRRQGTHKTKNKSEVSGTGKKPYRQKHTGRARQGSKRNPQFRGGGVAFGVSENRNYCIKVNKKVSKIALVSVWDEIVSKQNVGLLEFNETKANSKNFSSFLKKVECSKKKILIVSKCDEREVFLSSRNLSNVIVRSSMNCSVRDLLNNEFCFFTKGAIEEFYSKLSSWK